MGGAALCLNLHGWRNPDGPAGARLFEFLCCCQPLVVFDSLSRYRHRLFNPAATICCLPFHIMLHNHCLLSGHWRPRQDHEGHVQVRQLVEAGSGLQPAVMKPSTNVDMASSRMIGDQNERLTCSNVSAAAGCAYQPPTVLKPELSVDANLGRCPGQNCTTEASIHQHQQLHLPYCFCPLSSPNLPISFAPSSALMHSLWSFWALQFYARQV